MCQRADLVEEKYLAWNAQITAKTRRGGRGEIGNKQGQERAALPAAFEGHKECQISTVPGLIVPDTK